MQSVQRKIESYIGFAIKSRNIIFGADNILKSRKKMYLILITDTINRTSAKKINAIKDEYKIPLITIDDKSMTMYVKKENCKCLAILDKNLANAVNNSLQYGGATNE